VSTLAVENLVRGFASLLAAIELLQRFMPGTNTGSVAAAVGVPGQGERATPWASRPPSMGPRPAGARRLFGGLHGGCGGAAAAPRRYLTLTTRRRTAMNAQRSGLGSRAATVVGLVAGAVGIAILWTSGFEFPIYPPPGIFILLAGAIFVTLAPWLWAPGVGAFLGLFVTVGFVISGGPPNLLGRDGTSVAVGTWIQMAGVLDALIAGVIATRANYRKPARSGDETVLR
jgi:hypothetical protein